MSSNADLPPTYVEGFHDLEACGRMKYNDIPGSHMKVSCVGFGGCSFGNIWVEPKNVNTPTELLTTSIKAGINYIDTAPWYGHGASETAIGEALHEVPRKAYYIATKVGRYQPSPMDAIFDFSYKATQASIDASLARLQVKCIDLLQIHDPEFAPNVDVVINGCLRAMFEAVAAGKVRCLGVTGYPFHIQRAIIDVVDGLNDIPIVTSISYARLTLHDRAAAAWATELSVRERPVAMINAGSTGMGLFTPQGPPQWLDFVHPTLASAAASCREYCASRNINIARLAVAYSFRQASQHGNVVTTLMSCLSVPLVLANIATATGQDPLTTAEEEALCIVLGTLEDVPLAHRHWEGEEVQKYWTKLGKYLLLKHPIYSS